MILKQSCNIHQLHAMLLLLTCASSAATSTLSPFCVALCSGIERKDPLYHMFILHTTSSVDFEADAEVAGDLLPQC